MERWIGKVAIVTGASSGIGSAVAVDLVKAGMIVVGLARRVELVDDLKSSIPTNAKGKLYSFKCDVSNDDDVKRAFDWIEKQFGSVHILVNSAGVSILGSITDDGNEDKLKTVIQTNLWGMVSSTKKFFGIVKKRNVVGAHVININSVLGHSVIPVIYEKGSTWNIYPASKFGVTAVTETLRQEFSYHGLKTKVTSVSPGLVTTEMTAKTVYFKNLHSLKPGDISQVVLYALATPEHVQIDEIVVRPFEISKFDIKQKISSKM